MMLFGQHRPGEAEQGGGVGEDTDDFGAALISLFSRSSGLVDQTLLWRVKSGDGLWRSSPSGWAECGAEGAEELAGDVALTVGRVQEHVRDRQFGVRTVFELREPDAGLHHRKSGAEGIRDARERTALTNASC
jgi:hypothetical protein